MLLGHVTPSSRGSIPSPSGLCSLASSGEIAILTEFLRLTLFERWVGSPYRLPLCHQSSMPCTKSLRRPLCSHERILVASLAPARCLGLPHVLWFLPPRSCVLAVASVQPDESLVGKAVARYKSQKIRSITPWILLNQIAKNRFKPQDETSTLPPSWSTWQTSLGRGRHARGLPPMAHTLNSPPRLKHMRS